MFLFILFLRKKLDETTTALQKTSRALEAEKKKTEELLHEMLPKSVADQLIKGGTVKAGKIQHDYDLVIVVVM